MQWNWQQKDWPHFSYNLTALKAFEERLLLGEGMLFGVFKYFSSHDKANLRIELISNEALKTSEIEGEYLNQSNIKSSIQRHFGFKSDNSKVTPAEAGISELIIDLYENYKKPLSHKTLYRWYGMITKGRKDISSMKYRTNKEPMQIISGPIHEPKVHYEAPPSAKIKYEMIQFIKWYNDSSPSGSNPLSPLIRAGLAHWYFVCIHPFEDGNGRISRALAEKALSQCLGQPTLIALSTIIEQRKKDYYMNLKKNNNSNDITSWLQYFAKTILEAQEYTYARVEFLLEKYKFFQHYKDCLNARQEKALLRIFQAGPEGFEGGLSAKNYISITKATRPTATRDLQDLVTKGALVSKGELRYMRYFLNI